MNNLQLATTLVDPTGTGLLYTAYDQGSDLAIWTNGSGTSRSQVALKRTKPKPTASFAGVERLELKRTFYVTVNDVEVPVVYTITTSIPAVVGSSDRTACYTHGALLARDAVVKNGIELGVIPT